MIKHPHINKCVLLRKVCSQVQNSSGQYWYMYNVLHCSYVTKRKPCLHDGIVTIDLDKNSLVEIPPDDGLTRILLVYQTQPSQAKEHKTCLHFSDCACAIGECVTSLPQNGVVLEFQNHS